MTRWIKGSRCQGGGCVEVAWTRAGECDSGSCVEAGVDGDRVLVRDTHGAVIELRTDAWGWALGAVASGKLPPFARRVRLVDGGGVQWRGMPPAGTQAVTLRYTQDEWAAFAAGVQAGEFELDRLAVSGG